MHVNFISYKDTGETRTIFVRSDNKEIRLGDEIDDIVKNFLNLLIAKKKRQCWEMEVLIYCLIMFIK